MASLLPKELMTSWNNRKTNGYLLFLDKNYFMAKESTMKWKLGLFVSLALVLLIAALYFVGTQKNLFGSVFRLRAVFSSVSGLKTGSNVRFGGINVGTVQGIDLKTDTTVIVAMTIQKDVRK